MADAWRFLFEVNVHSNWLHIVQRVVFVERQGKVSFIVHAWGEDVLLRALRFILTRRHIDLWVSCLHVCCGHEPLLLCVELFVDFVGTLPVVQLFDLGLERALDSGCIF